MTEQKMDRWFLKCQACKKPWAVELPRIQATISSGLSGRLQVIIDESVVIRIARGTGETRWDPEKKVVHFQGFTPCPLCGNSDSTKPHKIMGRVKAKRLVEWIILTPCDGRCTGATGPNCDCVCNGKNHGTNRVVVSERKVQAIPG